MRYSLADTETYLHTLERRVSSAVVAIYTDTGTVLVVKAYYKDYWSFPGGIVDGDETPRDAAVREVEEETGVRLDPDSLKFVMVVDRISRIAQTYQFVFEVKVDSSILQAISLDGDEITGYEIVTREAILAGNLVYSQTTHAWAKGITGYQEQMFKRGGIELGDDAESSIDSPQPDQAASH